VPRPRKLGNELYARYPPGTVFKGFYGSIVHNGSTHLLRQATVEVLAPPKHEPSWYDLFHVRYEWPPNPNEPYEGWLDEGEPYGFEEAALPSESGPLSG